MDVRNFYSEVQGNYDEALSRLMNDALIEKFLKKFKDTQNLDALEAAIEANDFEKAFMEAHTLKGVSLNLALTKLGQVCSDLTEMLRGDNKLSADIEKVKSLFNDIQVQYDIVINKIN